MADVDADANADADAQLPMPRFPNSQQKACFLFSE